jgi:NAD(P)-dependent dehydrogenase (short-subunit alcohol dehydrogenase family)
MRVKDKVAIVVGAGLGIGKATALLLAAEGARVAVADLVEENARKIVSEIQSAGGEAFALKVDMTKEEETIRMTRATLDTFGKIDILCNVAGGSSGPHIREKPRPFASSIKTEWDRIIDINLTGARNCTRAVVNHMIERRYGRIVNFSSMVGITGAEGIADYCAAKAGIIGFTKALAVELTKYGITTNCVSPGLVATERMCAFPKALQEKMILGIHVGRMAWPKEVADTVLFLASDESGYITGQNIIIAGGKDLAN